MKGALDPVVPKGVSCLRQLGRNGDRKLIGRKSAIQSMCEYIDAIVKQDGRFMSASGKGHQVCATVGHSGKGKSALLEAVAVEQHSVTTRKSLFITYNSSMPVPSMFWESLSKRESNQCLERNLAAALLHGTQVDPQALEKLPEDTRAADAIQEIRSRFSMQEDHTLIVFVDELVKVERRHGKEQAEALVSKCMELQSLAEGSLVFVFSAFTQKQAKGWLSSSGRNLYPVPLEPLRPTEAKEMLLKEINNNPKYGWLEAWLNHKDTAKMQRILASHPRAFFDFLPQCDHMDPTLSLPSVMSRVFEKVDGLDTPMAELIERLQVVLRRPKSDVTGDDALVQKGVLEDSTCFGLRLVPICMRAMAYISGAQLPWQMYIRAAFDADLQCSVITRVQAEGVVRHFEALKRLAFADESAVLSDVYPGAQVGGRIRNCRYSFSPVQGLLRDRLVVYIDDFSPGNSARVMELLSEGRIVVSLKPNEKAIEHLVPLFSEETKELVAVLACQVKAGSSCPQLYVEGDRVPVDKICERLCQAAKAAGLRAINNSLTVIPLLMVNFDCQLASTRFSYVQLHPAALREWLHPLTPLQMLEEPVEDDEPVNFSASELTEDQEDVND